MPRRIGVLVLLLCLSSATAAEPTPRRVVSVNLCADVFLLHLAEPEQIVSVTFLAASSPLSPVLHEARGLPINHGQIEEILALQPDLVVAHRYGSPGLINNIRRLNIPLFILESPSSLEKVKSEIHRLAEKLGRQDKAHALLARYDQTLATTRAHEGENTPLLAVYGPNGITSGPGSLLHDLIRHTGFSNLAPRLGIGAVGTLRMETLLSHSPNALLFSDSGSQMNSLARQKLQHPALQRLAESRPSLHLPGKLWTCGGPELLDAAQALAKFRQSMVVAP